jgi:predicted nucleic acid-binding protein
MMNAVLLDTSILVRERDTTDAKHAETLNCIRVLWHAQWTLYITTQSLIEYWSVATRPHHLRGGLGLSPQQAEGDIAQFLELHDFLEEPPNLFERWRQIVNRYQVRGKQVWDARLVAIMELKNVQHLLTFNKSDFNRYQSIEAWLPNEVDRLIQLDSELR